MTGNLRDVTPRSDRAARDPAGKRAIFSEPFAGAAPEAATEAIEQPHEPVSESDDPRQPGTVVVECSSCGARTRVAYFDFALLNLPVCLFVPLPGRRWKHRMTCPACSRWTWVAAHWTE